MHIHSYSLSQTNSEDFRLSLDSRLSTDAEGVALLLGLQADANVDLEKIIGQLEAKLSPDTLFVL